jgi:hypothetical protein
MMDKAGMEKMFGLMMDMCCKGMPEEDKAKMNERMESCCKNMVSMMPPFKDMCKDFPDGFKPCCGQMGFSELMKGCCGETERDKAKA